MIRSPRRPPRKATDAVTRVCRVCGGPLLASSPWRDCHPACRQWPDTGRRYGPEDRKEEP
jgi:hypothetical protein